MLGRQLFFVLLSKGTECSNGGVYNTLTESTGKENLDGSWILVDRTEFGEISSASIEARRSKSFKKRVGVPFIPRSRSAKQGWHSELDPRHGQDKVVGLVSVSSIVNSSNQEEFSDSDSEII